MLEALPCLFLSKTKLVLQYSKGNAQIMSLMVDSQIASQFLLHVQCQSTKFTKNLVFKFWQWKLILNEILGLHTDTVKVDTKNLASAENSTNFHGEQEKGIKYIPQTETCNFQVEEAIKL